MSAKQKTPKRILLVDDEEDVVKVVGGRLSQWGYQTVVATNGQEALEAVRRQPPDLILLDLKMPVLSGRDACHELKADPQFAGIPVILMTSSTGVAVEEEQRAIRADGFVLKPFEPAELSATIRKWIG